jgi:flavorubredoxin
MELDLGGRHLYIIKLKPAHSYSSLFIYDETNKMLFCGDELDAKNIVMFDTSEDAMNHYDLKTILSNYASNLTIVKDLAIDFLLPSHNSTPIMREYLDDYREMAEQGFTASMERQPLSMPDLAQSSFASQLCTVCYKKAAMIVMKQQLDTLFVEK